MEGIDEVMGGDWVTVRPTTVFSQVEGIDRTVGADLPAFCGAWNQPGVGVFGNQALEQVALDVSLGHA